MFVDGAGSTTRDGLVRRATDAVSAGVGPVSPSPAALRLTGLVAALAAAASLVGLLWDGGSAPRTVVSVHGVTVELFGSGVYRYDSLMKGAGNRGADLVVLLIGLPLLGSAGVRYRRASARGALLLAGVLLWLLYLYLTTAVSTAHNELFLLYCAVTAVSGTALVLVVRSVDVTTLAARLTDRFPRRGTARFLAVTAAVILLLWGWITIDPLLAGDAPGHLFNATTTVTPALDLGLLLPAMLLATIVLHRGEDGLGCLVAVPLLVLIAVLAPLIPVQTLSQLHHGISFSPREVVALITSWVVLGLVASALVRRILRSVEDHGADVGGTAIPTGRPRERSARPSHPDHDTPDRSTGGGPVPEAGRGQPT